MTLWFRRYTAHLRGEPSEIMAIDKLISELMNTMNVSITDAVVYLLRSGMEVATEQVENDEIREGIESSLRYAKVRRELESIKAEKTKIGGLAKGLTEEEVLKAGKQAGMKPKEIRGLVEDCEKNFSSGSFYGEIQDWLDKVLKQKPVEVDTIKEWAARDNLLPGKEGDKEYKAAWNRLKSTASACGYSGGRRGEWQRIMN